MAVAALIIWIITALGGFYLLGLWISKGGHRQPSTSRFPPGLIFGHFGLAATGLVLWIVYVVLDSESLTWIAFAIARPPHCSDSSCWRDGSPSTAQPPQS